MDAEVSSDGAGLAVSGISLTQHDTTSFNDIETLPDHCHHRARGHVVDKTLEETLAWQVGVVFLQVLNRSLNI